MTVQSMRSSWLEQNLKKTCDIHKFEKQRDEELLQRLQNNLLIEDVPLYNIDNIELDLPDFLLDSSSGTGIEGGTTDSNPDYNPLLD